LAELGRRGIEGELLREFETLLAALDRLHADVEKSYTEDRIESNKDDDDLKLSNGREKQISPGLPAYKFKNRSRSGNRCLDRQLYAKELQQIGAAILTIQSSSPASGIENRELIWRVPGL
jgi:hypothetical protein